MLEILDGAIDDGQFSVKSAVAAFGWTQLLVPIILRYFTEQGEGWTHHIRGPVAFLHYGALRASLPQGRL